MKLSFNMLIDFQNIIFFFFFFSLWIGEIGG